MTDFQVELQTLNNLPSSATYEEFLRCCGSRRWAESMVNQKPFVNIDGLFEIANTLWWTCTVDDWFEAFSAHPKIGRLCIGRGFRK